MKRARSFASDSTLTFACTALALLANLLSGIIVARGLGPDGRGQLAAIMLLPQLLGWVFAMGCAQAVSYRLARTPNDGPQLFVTWLLMLSVLGILAIAIGEAVLPIVFDAQTAAARSAARVYLLLVLLVLLTELLNGMLLGRGDVLFFNLIQIAWAGGLAAAYLILVVVGKFTVVIALVASACVSAVLAIVTLIRVLTEVGLGRPSPELGRSTLSYGVRAHGANVSGLVTQRLDLFIIPAFLSASTIGLYSVATNVSWIVVTIAGAISVIVLPEAARRDPEGWESPRDRVNARHASPGRRDGGRDRAQRRHSASADLRVQLRGQRAAAPLAASGRRPLRGAAILWAGLYAANRPLTATFTQLPGLVVTIVGLLIFLPNNGIEAAAIISTISYSVIFVAALVLYRRAVGVTWGAFKLDPSQLLAVAARLRLTSLRSKSKGCGGPRLATDALAPWREQVDRVDLPVRTFPDGPEEITVALVGTVRPREDQHIRTFDPDVVDVDSERRSIQIGRCAGAVHRAPEGRQPARHELALHLAVPGRERTPEALHRVHGAGLRPFLGGRARYAKGRPAAAREDQGRQQRQHDGPDRASAHRDVL